MSTTPEKIPQNQGIKSFLKRLPVLFFAMIKSLATNLRFYCVRLSKSRI